jgi:single-strand selective monofunctional uracil DNA glycosylase
VTARGKPKQDAAAGPAPRAVGEALVAISRALARRVDALTFGKQVAYIYNPLVYARAAHEEYLRRFARSGATLLVGMNPGPFGMAQTGVPFGEVSAVRDWMGISTPIGRPPREHPKRPVLGFECPRSEVSGARLWGWARERFGTPERFFHDFLVWNYCPLAFILPSGANLTPDKLRGPARDALQAACDEALVAVVDALAPRAAVGIGAFAEDRIRRSLAHRDLLVGGLLHPSPASPQANRGWAAQAERQLAALGALPAPSAQYMPPA